jgi:hypothetical protein
MDRVMTAQHMDARDLLPATGQSISWQSEEESSAIPVVSHAAALFEPFIRPSAIQEILHMPSGVLQSCRARVTANHRSWQRFVAVRVSAEDAAPMEPLIMPNAIALIDRHYNSMMVYRPDRPNLYAVRHGAHLTLRYADYLANRLVLRPHNITFPVDLIEIEPGESPSDMLAGRVVFILNSL